MCSLAPYWGPGSRAEARSDERKVGASARLRNLYIHMVYMVVSLCKYYTCIFVSKYVYSYLFVLSIHIHVHGYTHNSAYDMHTYTYIYTYTQCM